LTFPRGLELDVYNIPHAPWFDPAKEAVVVLALNTRRRRLGHNLVTLGTLDTCIVGALEDQTLPGPVGDLRRFLRKQ
jgi:hypothetical protein